MSQQNGSTGDDFRERAIPTVPRPRTSSENSAKGRIPRQPGPDSRES
ncbi:hypothetical protein ACFXPX_38500 [Kitasatospora sp. NPDC059146]